MILSVYIEKKNADKLLSEKTPKLNLRLMERTTGPQIIKL